MYSGGCECKSVRYQFQGEPMTCYACHCTDCQTASGSAFALSMILNDKDIEVTEGEISVNTIDTNGIKVQNIIVRNVVRHFGFRQMSTPVLSL